MKRSIKPREIFFEVWQSYGSKQEYWGTFSGVTSKQIAKKFQKYAFPKAKIKYDISYSVKNCEHYNDKDFFFILEIPKFIDKIFFVKVA
jgi:hypothetical protein